MPYEPRTIVVVGEGTETGTPDGCEIVLVLSAMAETPRDALVQVTELANQTIAALGEQGVSGTKVQTTGVTVHHQFDQRQQRVIGCIGSYVISVRTSSIEEGSRVLEAVGGVGGDSLQVRGFHLFVSDPEPLRVVARRRAVEDALSRARQIADAAGVQMGGVLSIEEVSGFPRGGSGLRPLSGGAMLAAGGAPPVEPGSLSVDVSVTLTVEIAE